MNARKKRLLVGALPMGLVGLGSGVLLGYLTRGGSGATVWVALAGLVVLSLPLAFLSAYLTERFFRPRRTRS